MIVPRQMLPVPVTALVTPEGDMDLFTAGLTSVSPERRGLEVRTLIAAILGPSTAPGMQEGLRLRPTGSMDRCECHPNTSVFSASVPLGTWGD